MKRTVCLVLAVAALASVVAADELEKNFITPPNSARPWVYWFPLSGNLTKEGITADFEAMARVGIGGALYMEVDQGAPKGKADFAGPLWRELFTHACNEAHRLGLEISMNNDAGWCGSGGPWITPELSMQKVVWSETVVEGGKRWEVVVPEPKAVQNFYRDVAVLAMPAATDTFRLEDIEGKAAFKSKHFFPAQPAKFADAPAGAVIPRDKIVDLTGKKSWDVPAGKWLVFRFGYTTTGANNTPAPESGRGLECDKFSKEAAAAHYRNLMGKLVAENKAVTGQGKVLVSTHIDSWEVGSQNWTPKMREEFKARRGYEMLPFLPAFTGRVVDSVETTERFLWDLRQTVSDLIVENYAGEFRRLANKDGLRLSIEAYYGAPVDEMTYGGQADEPMSEFWSWGFMGRGINCKYSCTEMSSSAHIYGKRILGAEAFTASDKEKWQGHPASIKWLGDWAFCEGINRFVFHRYAAQPWTNVAPGMAMGPWGLHYERTQTWWEQSIAWHEYLARCQYLLQQGLFVADVLYLQPEGAARRFNPPAGAEIAPNVRSGYNFDGCTVEALLTRVSVKDGRLVLPDGMSYRVLVVPAAETMTPALIRKLKQLADAGATIIADAKPPLRSPSLADKDTGDAEVAKIAAGLWPRFVTGKTAAGVLAGRGVKPDFSATPVLRYIHKQLDDAEIYFVANPQPNAVEAVATFRVTGRQPEIWWPDTGRVAPAVAFEEKDGATRVPLSFEPSGSLFVVFRQPVDSSKQVVSITRDGKELLPQPDAPIPQPPDVSKTFTFVAWVRPDADTVLPRETKSGTSALNLPDNYVLYPAPGHEVWTETDAGAGLAVGRNGVTVLEHGANHLPAVLAYAAPITNWTHIAVVYRDGVPNLYVAGKLVRTGLKSEFTVHGGVGVRHTRGVAPFKGQRAVLQQFAGALTDAEILKLAQATPPTETRDELPAFDLATGEIRQSGTYVFKSATGQQREVKVALPPPQEITGPWEVSFDPKWGGPATVTFEKLDDWSQRPESGIKYYSGSATYRTKFQAKKSACFLDLGKVAVLADVKLNGKDLGTLWKPPYRVDVSEALKNDENTLELKVVNLWINRQIGDEQLPEDCDRNANGTLKSWPQWIQDGKPSPTGRFTFSSWKLWKKNDLLVESGLIGPVTLQTVEKIKP